VKVTWNGAVHTFTYALPDATIGDVIEALCGRLQISGPTARYGLFTEHGVELDRDAPADEADEELILRPAVIH
jgi:hypothetical protein